MKATIKIKLEDLKKLKVAGTVNQVEIRGGKKIGAEMSLVELSYRTPESLFETGRMIDKVVGNELDETPEETKAKAEKAPGKKA
jgi:hypothetical protein